MCMHVWGMDERQWAGHSGRREPLHRLSHSLKHPIVCSESLQDLNNFSEHPYPHSILISALVSWGPISPLIKSKQISLGRAQPWYQASRYQQQESNTNMPHKGSGPPVARIWARVHNKSKKSTKSAL